MKTNLIKTAVVSAVMKNKVYKVFTESEWKVFQKTGQFKGSKDDIRDGFIHLSTKEQVAGVIERFFAGKHPLYVAEFSSRNFVKRLKWETSSSNEVYPHLYSSELFVTELSDFNKLE
jgi:uncharacterized protein (DUF952 family)